MRAALYLRQSLDRAGDGLAVARQREDGEAICAARGWTPVAYVDNDTSASSGKKRPAYTRMLSDIAAGNIGAVVVWDLDRLHRRPIELEHFMELADTHKVALATVTGDVDLSTDNGRLFARIKGAVARSEVDRKAARQKRAARQKAEAGKMRSTVRPFGFTLEGNLIPSEADLIRQGYSAVLSGDSIRSIAAKWNGTSTTTKGGEWLGSTTRRVLMSPRNAGLSVYQGQVVGKAVWPAIVPEETFRVVQDLLSNPERRPWSNERKFLLSGILECGRCNDGTKLASGVQSKTGNALYVCRKCNGNSCQADAADKQVEHLMILFLSSDDAADVLIDRERVDVAALREEERVTLERMDKLAIDFYAKQTLTESQFQAASGSLQAQLEAVRGILRDATKSAVYEDLIGPNAAATWDGLGLARRRAAITTRFRFVLQPTGRGRKFSPDNIVGLPANS